MNMKQAALAEKKSQHGQSLSALIELKWKWEMEIDCEVTMLYRGPEGTWKRGKKIQDGKKTQR